MLAHVLKLNKYFLNKIPEKYRLPIYYYWKNVLSACKDSHTTFYICKFNELFPELTFEEIREYKHLIINAVYSKLDAEWFEQR